MHGRYRRPIAAFMGLQLLFGTSGMGLAEARGLARAKELAETNTIDLFDRDGKVVLHVGSSGLFARLAASARGVSRKAVELGNLDSLVAILENYSKTRKNSKVSFTMTLLVVEAHRAETYAEYREIIDQLPVTVERTAATDDLGRQGIQTEYRLKGIVKARLFQVADGERLNGQDSEKQQRGESEQPMLDEATNSSPPSASGANSAVDCIASVEM